MKRKWILCLGLALGAGAVLIFQSWNEPRGSSSSVISASTSGSGSESLPDAKASSERTHAAKIRREQLDALFEKIDEWGQGDGYQAWNHLGELLGPPTKYNFQAEDYRLLLNKLNQLPGSEMEHLPGSMNKLTLCMALNQMGRSFPLEAMTCANDLASKQQNQKTGDYILGSAFSVLANQNPEMALEWLRAHPESSKLVGTEACEIAGDDPLRAFALIDEFLSDPDDRAKAARNIGATAAEPEKRDGIIAAMDETISHVHDPAQASAIRENVLRGMGNSLCGRSQNASGPFITPEQGAAARAWLESSSLSPEDRKLIVSSISDLGATRYDTGNWLEWITAQRPGDEGIEQAKRLMRTWPADAFSSDAIEWIRKTQNTTLRDAFIPLFLDRAVLDMPDQAREAAMLLPAGYPREVALRKIDEAVGVRGNP